MNLAAREHVDRRAIGSGPPCGPAVALDIGGTTLKAALVTDRGRLVYRTQVPTHPQRAAPAIEQDLVSLHEGFGRVYRLAAVESTRTSPGLPVGLALPGLVSADGRGVARADNLPTLNGYPLLANLRRRLGRDLFVGTDCRCAAQADYTFGAGRGTGRLIVAVIGTGIGATLLVEGRATADTLLGQVGVEVPRTDGSGMESVPLESVASAAALDLAVRRTSGAELDFDAIRQAIESGPPAVHQAVRRWAAALARGFAEWAARLGPERIVIAGGVTGYGPRLLRTIRDACREHAPIATLPVEFSPLGRDAALVGAGLGAQRAARTPTSE